MERGGIGERGGGEEKCLSHSRFRVSLESDDSVGGQAQEFEPRGLENEKESIARSHGKKISLILYKYQRYVCGVEG